MASRRAFTITVEVVKSLARHVRKGICRHEKNPEPGRWLGAARAKSSVGLLAGRRGLSGGGVCRSTEPLWSKYGMRIAHGKGTSHRRLNATQIVGALALGFVETPWVAVLLELPNDIVGNGVALRFGDSCFKLRTILRKSQRERDGVH